MLVYWMTDPKFPDFLNRKKLAFRLWRFHCSWSSTNVSTIQEIASLPWYHFYQIWNQYWISSHGLFIEKTAFAHYSTRSKTDGWVVLTVFHEEPENKRNKFKLAQFTYFSSLLQWQSLQISASFSLSYKKKDICFSFKFFKGNQIDLKYRTGVGQKKNLHLALLASHCLPPAHKLCQWLVRMHTKPFSWCIIQWWNTTNLQWRNGN